MAELDPEWMLETPPPASDARLSYGSDALQFGDLYLPKGKGPHPLLVAVHGGFWRAQYTLTHFGHAADALRRVGFAVWSLEYRRTAQPGGGFPGTLADIAAGTDFLATLAPKYSLDLTRLVSIGHSAGGHLALWLAARGKIKGHPELAGAKALKLKAAVGLAAVSDLALGSQLHLGGGAVDDFMGGDAKTRAAAYALASPAALLPCGVTQRLIHGTRDELVPFAMSAAYVTHAKELKEPVALITVPDAGHFELINPRAEKPWAAVVETVRLVAG